MLKAEIIEEILHVFIIFLILFYGIIAIDIYSRLHEDPRCLNWEYNLNPDEGSGYFDAMVKP